MYSVVRKNIIEKKLINQGDNVMVGFSGGPDSVFLFHNLRLLREELGFNLYASHINHMYRGKDAEHDENFVRELCQKYGVRLFVKRKNTVDYAKELKVTEEEAGRILRYNFFNENLSEVGGGKIAVAHNLNDQAETVLQRIIRGTGIDGLAAMTFMSKNLIRPILNVQRSEIEKYLHENNFEYCVDKTNSQDIYGRNKIRLNLIPYLENNFNSNIQNTLYRMSENMESDGKIIHKYINSVFDDLLIKRNTNMLYLDLYKLKNLEDYELKRVLRRAIELLKGSTYNVELRHIDVLIEFIKKGSTGKSIDLSGSVVAEISYNDLIVRKMVEKFPDFKYNIILDEPLFIKETGKTIFCRILDLACFDINDKKSISIDYDKVKGSLIARNRRNGDSIVPCGMNGSKKIKDVFVDMKIPGDEREKRIIIADDSSILWVEGFRIHNSYKVSSSTKKILNISIMEGQND